MSSGGFDPWFLCGDTQRPLDGSSAFLLAELTVTSTIAGCALTQLVQSRVSLETRKQLIVFGHLWAGFIWMLPMLTCSAWTFPLVVGSVFLWGSEPYDNVLSPDFWRLINRASKSPSSSGTPRWLHYYWALSCPFVHLWFNAGIGIITLGLFRPAWYVVILPSLWLSHIARVFAYSYADTTASVLETLGLSGMVGCLAWAVVGGDPWWILLWLSVAAAERATHLPAALKRDAGWMRSYDLWEELLRSAGAAPSEGSAGTATSDASTALKDGSSVRDSLANCAMETP